MCIYIYIYARVLCRDIVCVCMRIKFACNDDDDDEQQQSASSIYKLMRPIQFSLALVSSLFNVNVAHYRDLFANERPLLSLLLLLQWLGYWW